MTKLILFLSIFKTFWGMIVKQPCVYILSNNLGNVIYIGVTSDIWFRILEHKMNRGSIFTKKYKLKKLIYYEELESMDDAIYREKQLKKWNRKWKDELINKMNPSLKDLAISWYSQKDIDDFRADISIKT